MLKLLGHPHSPLLPRPRLLIKSLSSTRPPPPPEYTSLDAFRQHLRKRLDHEPTYALPSIFRRIELTARHTGQPAAVYEAAFDALLWRKRLADAAAVLLHMPKKGLLASNATHATMLAVSLASELPEEVTLENVLNNICDIVAHREYTAQDLAALLRVMKAYDVDRRAVAVVANHFRESRGRLYRPPPALVPELVEAMVREGEVEEAFKMLEAQDAPDAPLEVGYQHLLSALRDVYPWDPYLVDRILAGIAARQLPRQTPLRLLLAWAAAREQYLSVLHFHRILREGEGGVKCDARVFQTLFEMHTTFLYRPAQTRFAPLAPRTLFRDMSAYFTSAPPGTPNHPRPTPSTYLLSTALTAFLRQRDYAGALIALHSFRLHRTPLGIQTFYSTVKFLVHRAWGDLAPRRKVRAGQIKWGAHFLGARPTTLDEGVVEEMLDRVRRERFAVREPLHDPGPPRARLRRPTTRAQQEAEDAEDRAKRKREVEERCGRVRWYMPSMAEMESAPGDAALEPERGVLVGPAPLERLLERALLAEVMVKGELDVARAEGAVRELVGQAREEMLGGVEGTEEREREGGMQKRDEMAKKDEVEQKDEVEREETETETEKKGVAEKEDEKDMEEGTGKQGETEHLSETREEEEPQAAPHTSRTTESSN